MLVMLAAMGALTFALIAAVVMLIAAIVVTAVFAARTKKRRERGKKLGGLVAIPIVLYALSIPVLVFFAAAVFVPAFHAGVTTDYDDCSQAIVSHEPSELDRALEAPDLELSDDGVHSYRNLLRVAIEYGDEECARVLLEDAQEKGRPIDLDEPLAKYDSDGGPVSTEYAIVMATSTSYSSMNMVETLIEFGADVNVADEAGRTPLHHACEGACVNGVTDTGTFAIKDTNAAVDALLAAGADIEARDEGGRTPWDEYRGMVRDNVDDGKITYEEALEILEERAPTLEPDGQQG